MAKRATCVVYSDEQHLADMVADGRLTAGDAEEVSEFARLLSKLGPVHPTKGPFTLSAMVALEEYSHDRDPAFAAKLRQRINERRSRGGC